MEHFPVPLLPLARRMLKTTRWGIWVLQRTRAWGFWWARPREQLTVSPYLILSKGHTHLAQRCLGMNHMSGARTDNSCQSRLFAFFAIMVPRTLRGRRIHHHHLASSGWRGRKGRTRWEGRSVAKPLALAVQEAEGRGWGAVWGGGRKGPRCA